jgi:hypothetical protein
MANEASLRGVIAKVAESIKDAQLGDFARELMRAIEMNPKLEVRISASDGESVVYISPQGRPLVTTLGRLMIRQLGFDPQKCSLMIQNLTDAYVAEIRKESVSFDVVNGDAIVEAYKVEWGAHSCMTGSSSSYTRFMAENPDTIAILLFKNKTHTSMTKARALLWNTIEGDRVLDRIYPNSGWHIDAIKKWAKDDGIVTRCNDSLPDEEFIPLSNNKAYNARVMNKSGIWSYMDTFAFGRKDKKAGSFILSNLFDKRSSFYLWTTGGNRLEYKKCAHCEEKIGPCSKTEEVLKDITGDRCKVRVCSLCFKEHTYVCEICGYRFIHDDRDSAYCRYCDAELKRREEKTKAAQWAIKQGAAADPEVEDTARTA